MFALYNKIHFVGELQQLLDWGAGNFYVSVNTLNETYSMLDKFCCSLLSKTF